ncbi:chemotaxis protein CheR [Aestuariibacter sp. GS-14]|uniref:chemotaxis protein CheB n=1 Tax=Aestuariibacter sp. GS-14 TaxID=2590670 RepID=UPI001126FC52|nr:chemotaxis protein CheB [Aestuariibacter sp. GS-14]TPV56499.1 chemotaxis protein CheR [Aestuariibacter sp. GS-14]
MYSDKVANSNKPTYVVGIGASAGGLEALQQLFEKLPGDLGAAYIIVQHLSPDFKSMMDELLSKHTSMPVHQANEGELLQKDTVYLIPAGKLMRVAEGTVYLSDLPPDNRINLPINELFRSLAEDFQNKAVGVILSGTGSDGSRGAQALKEMGALVIAQSPDEAQFNGMALNAINTGTVDFVLKVQDIPSSIKRFINHPLAMAPHSKFREHLQKNTKIVDDILQLINEKTELDFKAYKESTVSRRIEHRMSINNKHTLMEYWEFMNTNVEEIELLKQDLLIGVTQFFRDSEVWEKMYEDAVKPLVKSSKSDAHIRVWCPGCSTGEEAYSFAMLFAEAMLELGVDRKVTVFASDIDQSAIAYAASGMYPPSIKSEIPNDYLNRYFHQLFDNNYQVTKQLRSMVVFATHNLIQDPPFSNMDVVSCRNTLIYLQNPAQQKVMAFFHFALKKGGYLLLGSAETPGSFSVYFDAVDSRSRIFQKNSDVKVPSSTLSHPPTLKSRYVRPATVGQFIAASKTAEPERRNIAIGRNQVIDEFVPPSLVVNNKLQVVYSYGDTSTFTTKLKPGMVTNDLSDILQDVVTGAAISAVHQCVRERKTLLFSDVCNLDGERYSLKCFSFTENKDDSPYVVLSFIKSSFSSEHSDVIYQPDEQNEKRLHELDDALIECQKLYREALEELDSTREELQSSNEELMAANEELQSTNEELQSVNEELYTVNSEYQQKISELTDINNDLENLLLATKLAVLFLGSDLRIRRYTNAIRRFVNIIDFDINRDFRDLSYKIPIEEFEALVIDVANGKLDSAEHEMTVGDVVVRVSVNAYKVNEQNKGVIISFDEV